jgi:dipeptidyl aminopeptidase/acylaminoacyl peptidase
VPAAETDRDFLNVDHAFRLAAVSDPQLSPDGEWVAYTVETADVKDDEYDSALWMVSWDGKKSIQLTHGPDSASTPRWSPDGEYLAFLASRGPDASGTQVWLLDRDGGEARQLTSVKGSVAEYAWSPDSRRLALVANLTEEDTESGDGDKGDGKNKKRRQPIVIDRYQFKSDEAGYIHGPERARIYVFDVASGSLQALTEDTHYDEYSPVWSPDGKHIAFISNRDQDPDRTSNTDVYIAEATPNGQLRRLTKFDGQDLGSLAWSGDRRNIAYVQGPEPKYWLYSFSQVAILPADGGAPSLPTAALDRDTDLPEFSADGRHLYVIVADDRSRYLARVAVGGGKIEPLTAKSQSVTSYSRAGDRIVISLDRAASPAELYALENGKTRQLTRHNDGWLSTVTLGSVEGVEFESVDGTTQVGALITKPPAFDKKRRYPAILWIHGGPYGQDEFAFDFERELFAANGYVVVQVNYRGSNGKGKAFGESLFARWGSIDTADVIAGMDHAIELGYADPERLGVGGWSQGGIITNYVIASDTRFKAAISGAGAGNQLALYGSDQYIYFYETEFQKPWENPELWIELSYPFFHADRIRTPTLYVGGDRDFNVPIIGGEQMYQALKSLDVPTQLVIYPGEHHSFGRPGFYKDLLERYLAWYEKYLAKSEG